MERPEGSGCLGTGDTGNSRISFTVQNRKIDAYAPDASLAIAAKDVLLNREYEYLPAFELNNFRGLVIDAGANVGLFSILASNFAKLVVAIEPHPTNVKFLKHNLQTNNVTNVVVANACLWSSKDTQELYEGGDSIGHSIVKKTMRSSQVEAVTLAELISQYGEVDLLKLDVEGAEFPILGELDAGSLQKVRALVCEVHLDHGEIETLVSKLDEAGFQAEYFFPPLHRGGFSYKIDLHGLIGLKMRRRVVYTLASLANRKETRLGVLFAQRTP